MISLVYLNNINLIINTNNTSTVIQSINNRVNSYLNLEQKQIEDFINLLSLLKIKTINSATAFETLIRSVNEDNFIFLTRDQIYLLFKEFEIENNSKEHLNLLQSYTKEIQDTDWKYILTVGLPYKSIIANRNISRNNADINSTREEITILIHKKNDIYPDIKFKPIKFNISSKLIDIIPEEINIENSYAQNLDKIKFLNIGNDKIEKTSFNDFINKSNLSENDLKYFIRDPQTINFVYNINMQAKNLLLLSLLIVFTTSYTYERDFTLAELKLDNGWLYLDSFVFKPDQIKIDIRLAVIGKG